MLPNHGLSRYPASLSKGSSSGNRSCRHLKTLITVYSFDAGACRRSKPFGWQGRNGLSCGVFSHAGSPLVALARRPKRRGHGVKVGSRVGAPRDGGSPTMKDGSRDSIPGRTLGEGSIGVILRRQRVRVALHRRRSVGSPCRA
jgi:hypothetical protein